MKKLLPAFFALILCCSSCGLNNEGKNISEASSTKSAEITLPVTEITTEMSETLVPYEEMAEYYEGVAKTLYLHYLNKAIEQGILGDYRFIGVSVEKKIDADTNEFAFLAYYDVLPVNENDFNPGNGTQQTDRWVTGKVAEVIAIRDLLGEESDGTFSIKSQAVYLGDTTYSGKRFESEVQNTELEAAGRRLFIESLEKSMNQEHSITTYKVRDINIVAAGKDYFDFWVSYDTLSEDAFPARATGTVFKDGWVVDQSSYVVVHKVDGEYTIYSQGTGITVRNPQDIGSNLFYYYMEANKNFFSQYKILVEKVEYIGEDFFDYSVTFDMLPVGEDFMPGSGEKQADGWVHGKHAYLVMRDKGFGNYEIESISLEKIDRSEQ